MTFFEDDIRYTVVPLPVEFDACCEYYGLDPRGVLEQFISDLSGLYAIDRPAEEWRYRHPLPMRVDGLPPCLSKRDHKAAKKYMLKIAWRYWCKLRG